MRRPRPVPVSWLVGLITVVLLAGCADTSPAPDVDDARLIAADSDDENWLTYGRTYKEQRHSPLTEVSEETVGRLGLAWYYDMGTKRGLEGTPLVVEGVLYVTGAWSVMHAFDAATGERLWKLLCQTGVGQYGGAGEEPIGHPRDAGRMGDAGHNHHLGQ